MTCPPWEIQRDHRFSEWEIQSAFLPQVTLELLGSRGNAVSGMVVFAFIPQQEYLITRFLRVETLHWKILIISLVSGFLKVKRFETLVKADEVNVR